MEAYKLETHINIREALPVCVPLTIALFWFFPKLGFFVNFRLERRALEGERLEREVVKKLCFV